MGIVNGTTNFMLTKMTTEKKSYEDVLAEAQALALPSLTQRMTWTESMQLEKWLL